MNKRIRKKHYTAFLKSIGLTFKDIKDASLYLTNIVVSELIVSNKSKIEIDFDKIFDKCKYEDDTPKIIKLLARKEEENE